MLTRRDFLLNAVLTSTVYAFDSRVPRERSDLPTGIGIKPDCTLPLPPEGQLGTSPALLSEQEVAKAVLAKAPQGPDPIAVAKYFLAVGDGQYGPDWQPYAQGWPERWNPVIVTFFQATATSPEGDVTPWCAAFVNWCFLQAGKGVATRSASSGKFREFGTKTNTPIPGDIAVFRRTNKAEADQGHGHVGFFVADGKDYVQVLGGNQIEKHKGCHRVSSKRVPKNGSVLTLDSFRTDPRLHPVS